jgi:protein TonB
MKTFFLLFALFINQLDAQNFNGDGPEVTEAQFAGGNEQLLAWIGEQLQYPEKAAIRHIEGTVAVAFIIEADGTISSARLRSGLDQECDQEALRVIRNMPRWTPATINGKAVASGKTIRIDFRLMR